MSPALLCFEDKGMRIVLLGGTGFIGTNLSIKLAENPGNDIVVVGRNHAHFKNIENFAFDHVRFLRSDLIADTDYDELVRDADIVYHLLSSTVPTTSNIHIPEELRANVLLSANLFEACVRQGVQKVVFLSSGGTVYGKDAPCPILEDTPANPISSYGVQKITIEKLLYLYSYLYHLDYRIIRLSNPYGPFQRPNGVQGAVTTFTYKALRGEEISVYGDGSVVRDFLYIDDAVRGILNIVDGKDRHRTFNLGCGYGTSIKTVLQTIENVLGIDLHVKYSDSRTVDVPTNYLDIQRYESAYGKLNPLSLEAGIKLTADFLREYSF